VFIAIAPVCRVDACKSEVIQKAAKNTAAISMALVLDFDFMPHAMAKNRAVGAGMFLTNGGAIGLG
jgi:hypothetical protein